MSLEEKLKIELEETKVRLVNKSKLVTELAAKVFDS